MTDAIFLPNVRELTASCNPSYFYFVPFTTFSMFLGHLMLNFLKVSYTIQATFMPQITEFKTDVKTLRGQCQYKLHNVYFDPD